MRKRITILGAGFAGLELATMLSDAMGGGIDVTLIDESDAFVFGYSKLDVMFGLAAPDAVFNPYRDFAKPGVRLLKETITAIDPVTRRVPSNAGTHDCDYLVIALGTGYDVAATPGLAESGHEFYTLAGATRLREHLPTFRGGRVVIGVAAAPYKCPPAPSECALMLHDYLNKRGLRDVSDITLVVPLPSPIPPSPPTSEALLAAFAERNITFIPNKRVAALDARRKAVLLDDGSELPYDLYLGVPRHAAPPVLDAAGISENGWVPVNPRTLQTKFPDVWAIGDIAATGAPKAGVFAEGAARAVASTLLARIRNEGDGPLYDGAGTCYIEFGGGRLAKVDVNFFSGPKPTGKYHAASTEMRQEKVEFGRSRKKRWFGR